MMKVAKKIYWYCRNIAKDKSLQLKHQIYFFWGGKYKALKLQPNQQEIIISLTSYPKRLPTLYLVIESLFRQTAKVSKIVLWLSKEEMEGVEIPNSLKRQQERGLTIRYCNGNLQSYKKLLPSLQEYPNATIITVDDDIYYGKNVVKDLSILHQKYPQDIICTRAFIMKKNRDNTLEPYLSWIPCESISSHKNIFLTSGVGTLFPPNTLHKDVHNIELIKKLSPNADDIWFNAMARLAGTPMHCLGKHSILNVKNTQKEALWHINNGEQQNDIQLKRVFDCYNLYEKID